MARAKAKFGPGLARSKGRVIGLGACGLFGLWDLIKRRKGRGKRVHDDVAQGEERREKNKPIRKREQC